MGFQNSSQPVNIFKPSRQSLPYQGKWSGKIGQLGNQTTF